MDELAVANHKIGSSWIPSPLFSTNLPSSFSYISPNVGKISGAKPALHSASTLNSNLSPRHLILISKNGNFSEFHTGAFFHSALEISSSSSSHPPSS
eukprot:10996527-Ditylum_brightwellii.AAC.1